MDPMVDIAELDFHNLSFLAKVSHHSISFGDSLYADTHRRQANTKLIYKRAINRSGEDLAAYFLNK